MSAAAPNDPTATDALQPDDQLRQFPGYETLGVLGMGGMGVVYRARQAALQRLVAIKTLRNFQDAAPKDLARFRFEAEIVAQLSHPHIVQLYHVGDVAGQPFLAFELVEGGNLAKKIAGEPQSPRAAAQLVQTLSQAVHAAHLRGIIHRDLTPSNILLTNDGTPKIADFGLARSPDRSGQSEVIAGTASYMAPEQAWGDGPAGTIGPATDVYGLGAILYEMLTGRPPFKGTTSQKTLLMVYHDPPVRPSAIVPTVPRDLETICLRCLEKDPARRFASADELAHDLRRYLQGEPIHSRAVGWTERAWLWSRRNPLVAGLAAALIVAVIGGLGGTIYKAYEASEAANKFRNESEKSKRLGGVAEARRKKAEQLNLQLRQQIYEFLLLAAQRDLQAAERTPGVPELYRSVQASLEQCPPELRNFEWYWLWRRAVGSEVTRRVTKERAIGLAVGHDGSWLVTTSNHEQSPRKFHIWNTKNWTLEKELDFPADAVTVSPTEPRLAAFSNGKVTIWNREKRVAEAIFPAASGTMAWSTDGKRLALVGGGPGLGLDKDRKFTVETSPYTISIFDSHQPNATELAKPLFKLYSLSGPPQAMSITPDGKRLLAVFSTPLGLTTTPNPPPTELKIWNLENQQLLTTIETSYLDDWNRLAISPDGKWCAVAEDYNVEFFSLDGEVRREKLTTAGQTYAIAFSPDNRHLLVGSGQGTVSLFEVGKKEAIRQLRGHGGAVRGVGWLADDRPVSVAEDGLLKVWHLSPSEIRAIRPVVFDAKALRFAAQQPTGSEIGIWNAAKRELEFTLPAVMKDAPKPAPIELVGMMFSQDGSQLLTIHADRVVRHWDLSQRQVVKKIELGPIQLDPAFSAGPRSMEKAQAIFSRDGDRVLLATQWLEVLPALLGEKRKRGERAFMEVWNLQDNSQEVSWRWKGRETETLGDFTTDPVLIAADLFSQPRIYLKLDEDTWDAISQIDSFLHSTVQGRNYDHGKPVYFGNNNPPKLYDPKLGIVSPDGTRRVVTEQEVTKLLDAKTGRQLAVLCDSWLGDLQFSADGHFLIGTRLHENKLTAEIFDARPPPEYAPPP